MTQKPLISVISVTKNNVTGLQKTARFIANRAESDIEWIIVDGASQDGTAEFLKTTNAQWVSENDNGIYDAMNKGISMACGEYVIFLNAGDQLYKSQTLDHISKILQQKAPDFLYGDAMEDVNGLHHNKPAKPHAAVMQGMFTHHQAMVYKRSLIADLLYDTRYKISADYDLTLRFLEIAKTIEYMAEPLCIFESGGISQTNAKTGRAEQFQIRKTLKQPFWSNALVYARQSLAWTARRLFPHLFWRFRRRVQPSGNTASATSQI